jgi:hypothetical protein
MPAVLGGFRCFPVLRCRELMDKAKDGPDRRCLQTFDRSRLSLLSLASCDPGDYYSSTRVYAQLPLPSAEHCV